MTTFVLQTLEREMQRIGTVAEGPARVFRGVPGFFKASCYTAQRGGATGYDTAGWNLGLHAASMLEPQDDDDAIDAKLEELGELLDKHDDDGVIAWFEREFPKCMALVPRRKHLVFLKGVYAIHEEHDITSR